MERDGGPNAPPRFGRAPRKGRNQTRAFENTSTRGKLSDVNTAPLRLAALFAMAGCLSAHAEIELRDGAFHVSPGDSIQAALDRAASHRSVKTVRVHAGTYRPDTRRIALVWLNAGHDGIRLEAVGDVTLTAANPEISDRQARSHPAVVNHVVYFGDGITTNTVLKGFRITGANGFVTREGADTVEPNRSLKKGLFFFADGGGIKIFGRSFPTVTDCAIEDNFSNPCGAGVSVEHNGRWNRASDEAAVFANCVFRNNRAEMTGAAFDVLAGSSVRLVNCLFTGNVANLGPDTITPPGAGDPFTNSGALTVFQDSRAIVERCTFTGNRNGVDDMSNQSRYLRCLFWKNDKAGGLPGERYDLDLYDRAEVKGCAFGGKVTCAPGSVSPEENRFRAPDPKFDDTFAPRAGGYENVGFRPAGEPR